MIQRLLRLVWRLLALCMLLGAIAPLSSGATWSRAVSSAGRRDDVADVAAYRGRVFLHWVRLDAVSGALYLGGTRFCTTPQAAAGGACPPLLARSSDGGTTWVDLSRTLGVAPTSAVISQEDGEYATLTSPLIPANDGRHLYFGVLDTSLSSNPHASGFMGALASGDAGLTWAPLIIGTPNGALSSWSANSLVVSPVASARLYALRQPTYGGDVDTPEVATSADGGRSWSSGAPLDNGGAPLDNEGNTIIPDGSSATTVYAMVAGGQSRILRSVDAGATWSRLTLPAGIASFTLSTDPRLPARLVGTTADAGVPADRRYLSDDQGGTWRAGSCPGDLHGTCPRFVADNVFGAGASYAFLPSGIYRFHGDGPAEDRLSLSARLPFATAAVAAIADRGHPGDPLYVLTTAAQGSVTGVLYRSADGGKIWDNLLPRALPNLAAPSRSPGTLYVPGTRHSVGAPFVNLYKKLGSALLGYPVTEVYAEGSVLTQDFEHVRLEVIGGAAVVGSLSNDVLFPLASRAGVVWRAVRPAPSIKGAFLPFWQAHRSLLGAPLTEQFPGTNGDGSGRVYTMQYFANGRLELHPEAKDPRNRVLLGLVGCDLWGFDHP